MDLNLLKFSKWLLLLFCLCATNCFAFNKDTLSMLNQLNVQQSDYAAHWLTGEHLKVKRTGSAYYLVKLNSKTTQWQVEQFVPLIPRKPVHSIDKTFPHLAKFNDFSVSMSDKEVKSWLQEKTAVVVFDKTQKAYVSYLQTANLIDHIYSSHIADNTPLGAQVTKNKITISLWAPTAKSVSLKLFANKQPIAQQADKTLAMQRDDLTGIWSIDIDKSYNRAFYQYQVTVFHPASGKVERLVTTDPYSLSLSTNSKHSQIVSLDDALSQPEGWHLQQDNPLTAPEDAIFYETHIRDFSYADKQLTNEASRGKYGAFLEKNSDGIKHIKALANAGINHIHLLPAFDIGTVNEDPNQVIDLNSSIKQVCTKLPALSLCSSQSPKTGTLAQNLHQLDALGSEIQDIISTIKPFDNYNWGYDPFHYTVPEGSYAKQPHGLQRIVEFREMVMALHNLGFRVIMDVVYNHTHQAGLSTTSVLDKIVPNYYQRLNPVSGLIEQSTCCDNTATERKMMAKLMIDSLVVWARDYKIDGFRFDLMAHQPKAAMLKARQIIQAIDPDNYFYGEGWNFGEVANNQRFVQASQLELAGTEIGTFTDRLRDAVRGGAFSASGNDIRKSQGIGSGLLTANNELVSPTESKAKYALLADQLRIGLAANLKHFPLINANGQLVTGKDILYGDQPTGYALDPADTINYVSKHDNQTLWDNNQYRLPFDTTTEERVRWQLLSLSYPIFAQGIPFIHMGSELLRSKSFLRDSYDYNDWYNRVDFAMQSNNYHVGLPPAEKDQTNWPLIKHIIKENDGQDMVTASDIAFSKQVFLDLIKIRMSSPLFRLRTAQQIIDQVKFLNTGKNQQPGVIVMSIKDENTMDFDANDEQVIVVFNSNTTPINFALKNAKAFKLHPVLKNSTSNYAIGSKVTAQGFTVPAISVAVFVR